MKYTKLDRYDYEIYSDMIRIKLIATTDPDLVDIMSEINRSNGRIYVEGRRFSYLENYRIYTTHGESYIELDVAEVS